MANRKAKSRLSSFLDDAFDQYLRRVPKQSRSKVLVSAILDAVDEQLSSGKDPDQVTIEAISDRAGVGIGSFYEYFSSKDSLFGALVGHLTEKNFAALAARLDAHQFDDIVDVIGAFAEDVTMTYLAHPKRMRVINRTIARLGLLKIVNRERDRFVGVLTRRACQLLPDEDPARLARTMQLVADGIMGVIVSAAEREPPDRPEVVRYEIADLALGLLARRHPAAIRTVP